MMTPEDIEALFTRADGSYVFARWGRPIAPIVFGVEDRTLSTIKGAFEAVMALSGHKMAETDPELGSNTMVFFLRDWDELAAVPDLDRLIEGLAPLLERLKSIEANQYRVFRFDEAGAIKACFIFIRMDDELSQLPAETLALSQVVQSVLLWSDLAFTKRSALGQLDDGRVVLRPEIAGLIRAAYDPVMPSFADVPSHALRLHARLSTQAPSQ
ncbi:hypothetical protein FIU91_16325 [Roseivivax sp. THAF30]|nr:hypothetical protein FIU91_16325 [Roseivivax sp. THAF30]